MKRLVLGSLVSLIGVSAWAQPAEPRVSSPEVSADRHVTFRLLAPQATTVVLTGEFMPASRALERDATGLWSVTVGPLEPEIYHYNFTIDGVRTIDPGNPDLKTGSTFSTLASVLEVRGDRPAFYDGQPVPHGEIRTRWYHSKSLNALRRFTVYTPPEYDKNPQQRYPVLYLFHGANADETAWYRLGRANLILDNLLAAGTTRPFIVVMPFGYGVPPGAPAPPGKNTEMFGRDLIDDVIPSVETTYRVLNDRDHRAIVGLSMGGGQALSIGLNHLDLFSHVGGFSSGLGPVTDFATTYASAIAQPAITNSRLRLLWVGCGTSDGAFAASKSFSDFLTSRAIVHTFRASEGAHTWMVWRRYLHEIAPLLFKSVT
jgi:enterochelin esterase family protein